MFKVYLGQWQMWSLHGTENPEESDRNGPGPHIQILNIMKNINDFIFEQEHVKGPHGIFEMAQISDNGELPKNSSVWVYGENDEQGIKPPHFHIKIDNRFEFEIKFDNFHNLDIWRSKTIKHDWKDYSNVKKELKKWLNQNNSEQPEYTNLEVILSVWNMNNPNHKIDKKYYIDLYNKLK